jgi:predicted dehydrogenase
MALRVAIVGCGRVGRKRALALGEERLVAVSDTVAERACVLAAEFPGSVAEPDWQACVTRRDVDVVIVSTVNASLASVTLAAVRHGKHVLLEKPGARNAAELAPLLDAASAAGVRVKVGFNHRFHPALWKARELCAAGGIGPVLYVRARYGHGGRLGYEREWRAEPTISGGGELLDQGVHLIDLARWFCGEFVEVAGHTGTLFWKMPVEDNAFLLLKTARGQVAWLHASCTEWKNLFSFEVFGRDGTLQIDGLGGSYGVERLTHYRMKPEMGPPDTRTWEFHGPDESWRAEFAYFRSCIADGRQPEGSLHDARAALEIIDRVYAAVRAPWRDAA